jgi:Domain of unknown function (DUF4129)
VSALLGIPIDIGRDQAAAAAQAELSKPVYGAQRPGLAERFLQWLGDTVASILDHITSVAPGGALGLVVLAIIVVLIVVLVRWRLGPVRRAAAADHAVFAGRPRSAAQYRAAADAAAAAGDWDEAVRQRFRALVRALEERDILDPRPGRTADESADEAALVLPSSAASLSTAARAFDDVAYGGLHADAAADARLRDLDGDLARTSAVRIGAPAVSGAGWEPLR